MFLMCRKQSGVHASGAQQIISVHMRNWFNFFPQDWSNVKMRRSETSHHGAVFVHLARSKRWAQLLYISPSSVILTPHLFMTTWNTWCSRTILKFLLGHPQSPLNLSVTCAPLPWWDNRLFFSSTEIMCKAYNTGLQAVRIKIGSESQKLVMLNKLATAW